MKMRNEDSAPTSGKLSDRLVAVAPSSDFVCVSAASLLGKAAA